MKRIHAAALLQIVTLGTGLVILAGYFVDIPALTAVRSLLLEWAVVLGGILLIGGVVLLAALPWRNGSAAPRRRFYRLTLLISLLATFALLVWDGTSRVWSQGLLKAVFLPIESSLVGLLAFVLLAAAVRMAFYRRDGMAILFLAAAGISLLSAAPAAVVPLPESLSAGTRWLTAALTGAGVRGLLIGVALGSAIVALRFLMGFEHPHDG